MPDRLPTRVNPFQLAARGTLLRGALPLAGLERLEAVVGVSDAHASIELEFHTDESGQPRLSGSVMAEVVLACQRCLAPVREQVDSQFELMLVRSHSEAASVAAGAEPLLVADETFSISELVEDELLLALPALPVHQTIASCDPEIIDRIRYESDSERERESPFAVLKYLNER